MTGRFVGKMASVAARDNANVIKRRTREGRGVGMTRFAILIGEGSGMRRCFAKRAGSIECTAVTSIATHSGDITVVEQPGYGKGIRLHTMARAALHACRIRNMAGGFVGSMARGAASRYTGVIKSNAGKGCRAVVTHAAILPRRRGRMRGCFRYQPNVFECAGMAGITTY